VRLLVTALRANTTYLGLHRLLACSHFSHLNGGSPEPDLTALTPSTTYHVRALALIAPSSLRWGHAIFATPVPNCPTPRASGLVHITNTTAVPTGEPTPALAGSTFSVVQV
jgi:hypothetical protein